jgi:hypothetical protein
MGGTIMIALASEAAPQSELPDPCDADAISFCRAYERVLERTNPHTPENEYETFGGGNSGFVVSGGSSSAVNTPAIPLRYRPTFTIAGEEP